MTGLMLLGDPPDREHLRIEWQLTTPPVGHANTRLWFWDRRGLGTLRLYSPGNWPTNSDRAGWGPTRW